MRRLLMHDTLSGEVRELEREPGKAGIYACGPTVYGRIHIGNARPYVIFTLLKRFLEHEGRRASLVINITDINDKIYDAAREAGQPLGRVRRRDDGGLPRGHRPAGTRPTGHGAARLRDDGGDRPLIEALIEGGHAYQANGDIYSAFAASTATASSPTATPRNGSGRGSGYRLAEGGPLDFALWKARRRGRTPPGTRRGGRGGRAGTSSAPRWRRRSWALSSRSTAAESTWSFPTTRTRSPRPRPPAASRSPGPGCTTGWSSWTRRRCGNRRATSSALGGA